ncbi:P-II family nitrogen regulator [Desulfoluna spongiiphila]|uniref:Nitrogen regulatory protein P-II family n=1 Tax=Desulfoluna spongiiphila TaxID=419481 RepID=A0A1G5JSQ9_9BACT|nr:P-II family nitrogen regulator [Desulfoluna spongiiphila]SCY90900.1 nitrogen regulatory protein P-II family [Desulfoluna spongiiphila]
MKEVIAIIRMNMMNQTKRALADAGISSMTAREVLGRGKGIVDLDLLEGAEHGYEEAVSRLGQTDRLIPKRLILVSLPDNLVDTAVQTIIRVNQTKKSGDGKIFVLPSIDAVRIRTGEHGDAVLDEL